MMDSLRIEQPENETARAMLRQRITGRQAWVRDSLGPEDWTVAIPPDCLAELRGALAALRHNPLPLFLLSPADFALEHCSALMRRVRAILDDGIMFAVLDRLPMDEMSRNEPAMLDSLLASLPARPGAPKLVGTMAFLAAVPVA